MGGEGMQGVLRAGLFFSLNCPAPGMVLGLGFTSPFLFVAKEELL